MHACLVWPDPVRTEQCASCSADRSQPILSLRPCQLGPDVGIRTLVATQPVLVQDAVTMINTNVTAVALLTRQFAPGMVQRNKGHIINISSIAAHYHYKGGAALARCSGICIELAVLSL